MQPPEEQVRRELVSQWAHKAAQDIRAAESLLSEDSPLLYPSCFFSQQAAERRLKAFLTWRQVEFPKTHSIRQLLNLAKTVDPLLAKRLIGAATLTVYGVEVRYPGELPEPDSAEARTALDLAKKVRDAVLRALPLT
ncbi:MAG: HEPN domain-containing protein [Planctomycetes bacterium]|nr:HEPN domain-containing protein [Planctomycetota bacterium]